MYLYPLCWRMMFPVLGVAWMPIRPTTTPPYLTMKQLRGSCCTNLIVSFVAVAVAPDGGSRRQTSRNKIRLPKIGRVAETSLRPNGSRPNRRTRISIYIYVREGRKESLREWEAREKNRECWEWDREKRERVRAETTWVVLTLEWHCSVVERDRKEEWEWNRE